MVEVFRIFTIFYWQLHANYTMTAPSISLPITNPNHTLISDIIFAIQTLEFLKIA
jgi:hypothetical protein